MIEWQLRPRLKNSSHSEQAFVEGSLVTTYLFRGEDGELERADILLEEEEDFPLPDNLIGKWTLELSELGDDKAVQKEAIKGSEDFFISLYAPDAQPSPESDLLKQLLALKLEQKRILRAIDFDPNATQQEYLHVKSKNTYTVPLAPIQPEMITKIHEELNFLISI